MLNALQRKLPVPVRNAIRRRQDAKALDQLPIPQCDVRNLRTDVPILVDPLIDIPQFSVRTGAVNPGDQRALYAITKATGAKGVLEIGTHVGGSTLMWARALPEDGHVTTVDILDVNGPEGACAELGLPTPLAQLESLGLAKKVTFVADDSIQFLSRCPLKFDLIFLDGLHDAAQVYQEIPLALRRLNPNGLILLHDVFPNLQPLWDNGNVISGPWMAVKRLRHQGAQIRVQPLGALPWPTKLNSNVTSLAYLLRS